MTPGFAIYRQYLALLNHFTKEEYDYHKYNGMTNVKESTYKVRKDRWHFEKIAKKYGDDSFKFILSNMMAEDKFYVRRAMDNLHHKTFLKYEGYRQSNGYMFEQDIKILSEICEEKEINFNDLFLTVDERHPPIHTIYSGGYIEYYTVCILNSILGFTDSLDDELSFDPIWQEISFKLRKSTSFFFPKKEYKDIIKKVFTPSPT